VSQIRWAGGERKKIHLDREEEWALQKTPQIGGGGKDGRGGKKELSRIENSGRTGGRKGGRMSDSFVLTGLRRKNWEK